MNITEAQATETAATMAAARDAALAVAIDLAAFNAACEPIREANRAIKPLFPVGTAVQMLKPPRGKAGVAGVVVGYEGSHFGNSVAHVKFEGTKRTYLASVFTLFHN